LINVALRLQCCGGQTDRDATVAELTAQLVRTVRVDVVVNAACRSTVHCVWQCYDGQTDREGVVADRDAAVAQLTGQLVRSLHVDVDVSAACWATARFMR
jgi:hypothetical protein